MLFNHSYSLLPDVDDQNVQNQQKGRDMTRIGVNFAWKVFIIHRQCLNQAPSKLLLLLSKRAVKGKKCQLL